MHSHMYTPCFFLELVKVSEISDNLFCLLEGSCNFKIKEENNGITYLSQHGTLLIFILMKVVGGRGYEMFFIIKVIGVKCINNACLYEQCKSLPIHQP